MLSRVLRARGPLPKLPTFRAARPSLALVSHRTSWEIAALNDIANKFGPDWYEGNVGKVTDWVVEQGLEKVGEYLKEKPEEAIQKAARDAKLARDDQYEELLPIRYDEREDILQSIVETCWMKGEFILFAGPKGIGKTTLLHSAARELNTREGYQCIYVRCEENEEEFLKGWLAAMGLSLEQLSDVPSFEQVAKFLILGRGQLQFKHSVGEDVDFHGSTELTVDQKQKTIVFVDGMRARHEYVYRLQDIARQHSEHDHVMYVLIASDSADAFRSVKQFETRVNQIICHPFETDTMKEFIRYKLRERSIKKFGDADHVVIDDEEKDGKGKTELDRLVDVVKKYTWQASNGAKFAVKGVQQDGSVDAKKVADFAKDYCNKYSMYVKGRLFGEAGWNMDQVRELIAAFGASTEMDVFEYEQKFSLASILSQRNFAYYDEEKIYLMPEVYHAMKFMIEKDDAVKSKNKNETGEELEEAQ